MSTSAMPSNLPSSPLRTTTLGKRRPIAILFVAVLALVIALAVVVVGWHSSVSADTSPPAGQPATVSADGLPTVQVNGVVWAQVTVGTTVYATGSFTQARPAGVAVGGTGSVTRSNLLAYNITTGVLNTSFNHTLNAQGRAIAASPNGATIYVGGNFTKVDGVTHNYAAAFSTSTGALISTFTPSLNAAVLAIAASNTTTYFGGIFTAANGSSRSRLAAYTSAGALTAWNPSASSTVDALTLTPDGTGLVVGGYLTTLAGTSAVGMGAVSASTGASRPWAANTVIQDSGTNAAIYSLTADATQVYGTGYFYTTGGNFEGRFAANPSTGAIVWLNNCHGDSYDVYSTGTVLYSAGHEHDCSDIGGFSQDNPNPLSSTHHFLAAEMTTPSGGVDRHPLFPGGAPGPVYHDFAGQPDATQLYWYPTLTEGTYTGQYQAAWSLTGNSQYLSVGGEFPTVNGNAQQGLVRFAVTSIAPNKVGPTAAASLTPLVYSQSSGTARVAWQSTWDPDNTALTYSLYRDSSTTPIYSTTVSSTFWNRPNIGYLDTGLTAGSSHSYKVTVRDPSGNSITSAARSVTVGSASVSTYTSTVLGSGATHFWPLSDSAGSTTAADRAGYADVTLAGNITLGTAGPVSGTTAATFGGGQTTPPPSGNGPPPQPVPNDTAGTVGTIAPGSSFSTEAWVKTTSTQGGAIVGLGLYNASNSAAVDKVVYMDASGKLHFGVQNNTVLQTIDTTASYNDGAWHLIDATYSGGSATLYVDGVQVAAGSIVDNITFDGYWRIGGDNLAGWTAAPAGNYLAGSIGDVAVYPAALSASVVAAHESAGTGGGGGGNQPPTAAFVASCTQLACTFDGGSSTDPDGTISSYAWSFGDGSTATGSTANHSYATAGNYNVTLTVTDNDGATGSQTQQVTATSGTTALANDTFNRTVAGGFGTAAPTGGAWTSTGTAADLSVSPGAAAITLAAAKEAGAYLPSVSTTGVDVLTALSLPTMPVGGNGYYFYGVARRVSSTEQYLVRVRVLPSGAVNLSLSKYDGSATETTIVSEATVATVTAGSTIHLRFEATGTASTTLRARVWIGTATEPTTWNETATDSSAALQAAGSVGVQGYLSGSVTNGPIAVALSGFTATAT
jgi:hypothetical protein